MENSPGHQQDPDGVSMSLKFPPQIPAILKLPVELHFYIIDSLSLQADLKSICLSCKALSTVLTQLLYHKIDLGLCRVNRSLLENTFRPDNVNLAYIRQIRVYDPSRTFTVKHRDIMWAIVDAVPKHQLRAFTVETRSIIPLAFTAFLHRKQSRLENYALHWTDDKYSTSLSPLPAARDFHLVVRLSLCVGNNTEAKRACELLSLASNVNTLTIMCPRVNANNDLERISPTELQRILFTPDARVLKIRRLLLHGIALRRCAAVVASSLQLICIEELILVDCENTVPFLADLDFRNLSLKVLVNHCAMENTRLTRRVSAFLSSVTGLQRFFLSLQDDSQLNSDYHWPDLHPHAPSLRSLMVDDSCCHEEQDFPGRNYASLEQLLQVSTKLEFLGIQAPYTSSWESRRLSTANGLGYCVRVMPPFLVSPTDRACPNSI
nr:hypothetical protein CFP56_65191 [Quercus suber]